MFDGSDPQYLSAANAEIEDLVQNATLDELGSFIEATDTNNVNSNNIHNLTHGTVGAYEAQTFGPNNPNLTDASMRFPQTAPHNEHFWALHGWIDNFLASWQTAHGEAINQSPLDPAHGGHAGPMTPFAMTQTNEVSDKLRAITETTFTLEFPAIWDRRR